VLLFRFSLLLISLLLLNACSGNQALESLFAADPKLKENYPNLNSSPPNTEENQLPENFPAEIPIYSSAKLINTEGNKTTWTSGDPVNLINNFYVQELKTKKWSVSEQENNLLIATNADRNKQLKLSFLPSAEKTEFTLEYYLNSETSAPQTDNVITENTEGKSPENSQNGTKNREFSSYLPDLVGLNIINPDPETLGPNKPITRREYARWLIKANNTIHGNSPSLQIRPASENVLPVFTDVDNQDPDFAAIQGLAEAGLIPSSLTKDANAILFRPDAPLTREDLIRWKVPLDIRRGLPTVSLDTIKETWGFQDATQIDPQVWRSLYVDWQNGDRSNVKRAFGYTTLFQPKKPVTLEEAAAVLWYFGYQGDGLSASELSTEK
jgi:hypothetical protein